MNLRRSISAALVDAGLSSLATLGVGVYAASTLPAGLLGAYAVFFSAFVLATVVPAQLVLAPATFAAAAETDRPEDRLRLVSQTWRLGLPPALASAVLVMAAAAVASGQAAAVVLPLVLTTLVATVISPLQDHLRRVLHIAGRGWGAAMASATQLVMVAAALAAAAFAGVGPAWRPFGALAVANAASLAVAVARARVGAGAGTLRRLEARELVPIGRWLLVQQVAATGALFVSSVLVSRLTGPADLGQAEAARVVAQPVLVLTTALHSVLWPASTRAAATLDRRAADRVLATFGGLLLAAGALYGAVTAVAWAGNPFARLLPAAYAAGMLVPLSVLGYLLAGLSYPFGSELVGAGRERSLAAVAGVAAALQCAMAAGAAALGAAARPAGTVVAGVGALVVVHRFRGGLYRTGPVTPEGPPALPGVAGRRRRTGRRGRGGRSCR